MSPWTFGWDAITALSGIAAVVVASVLGWLGVRMAARSVERTNLDYVAARTDRLAELQTQITVAFTSLMAARVAARAIPEASEAQAAQEAEMEQRFTTLSGLEVPLETALISLEAIDPRGGAGVRAAGLSLFHQLILVEMCLSEVSQGMPAPRTTGALTEHIRSRAATFEVPAPSVDELVSSLSALWDDGDEDAVPSLRKASRRRFIALQDWLLDTVRRYYEVAAGELATRRR